MRTRTTVIAMLLVALVASACTHRRAAPSTSSLPLRLGSEIALPGDSSRFDYASVDAPLGRLFVAHLGASQVIDVDVRAQRVVRTIPNVSEVHGVLVVPALGRVYATATGTDELVAFDENSGQELARAATGTYPDGLAYDTHRSAIWTTNETGGTESVFDATSLRLQGSVDLGGEVGNVAYEPAIDRILVAVQGRNDLAVIDPSTRTVIRRAALTGCEHPHGLAVDVQDHSVFVACDGNATLAVVDETTWNVVGSDPVGDGPDVVVYDDTAHRLYVAAESGILTVFDVHGHELTSRGQGLLVANAHVVAVDPETHRSYYPVPAGTDGRPALLQADAA
jgi:DNA-binding beta-propeller fold protein YncE